MGNLQAVLPESDSRALVELEDDPGRAPIRDIRPASSVAGTMEAQESLTSKGGTPIGFMLSAYEA